MGRTHEALHRAEKSYQRKRLRENSYGNIESLLVDLGLGEEQILKQNFSQLKRSFNRVNVFITRPESFFKLKAENNTSLKVNHRRNFLKILLKRKEHILECFDKFITKKKLKIISQLVKEIPDNQIRLAIEKKLNDLKVKDNFLMKEYGKIVQLEKKLGD